MKKTYLIKYRETEIYNQRNYNAPVSYNYGLSDVKKEVIMTDNIEKYISNLEVSSVLQPQSAIFPNMSREFVLVDVVKL